MVAKIMRFEPTEAETMGVAIKIHKLLAVNFILI